MVTNRIWKILKDIAEKDVKQQRKKEKKKKIWVMIKCNCGSVNEFSFNHTAIEKSIECKNPDCGELFTLIKGPTEDIDDEYIDDDDERDSVDFWKE